MPTEASGRLLKATLKWISEDSARLAREHRSLAPDTGSPEVARLLKERRKLVGELLEEDASHEVRKRLVEQRRELLLAIEAARGGAS